MPQLFFDEYIAPQKFEKKCVSEKKALCRIFLPHSRIGQASDVLA